MLRNQQYYMPPSKTYSLSDHAQSKQSNQLIIIGAHADFKHDTRNDHDQPHPMRNGHHMIMNIRNSTSFARVGGVVIRGVSNPISLALVWNKIELESALDQPHYEPIRP